MMNQSKKKVTNFTSKEHNNQHKILKLLLIIKIIQIINLKYIINIDVIKHSPIDIFSKKECKRLGLLTSYVVFFCNKSHIK